MSNKKENKPKIRFPEFTDDWEQRRLGDIFEYEQPGPYIVSSTEYSDNFTTPVLTAGQSFILGYTNEKKGIKTATSENPVIIFDDFTTTSHLVNFNFKVKSSAIKILSLNNKKDNIYCANSVLKNIRYIPANHERHWISKFANFSVFMPSCLEEQKKIGDFIKLFDELIDLYYKKIQILKRIKKGFLQKLFPKKDEINPELRFPGFTDDWEHRKFFDLVEIERGSSPRPIDVFITNNKNGLNWVKIGDAPKYGNYITKTEEKIIPEGLSKTRQVHPGDLILSNSMSFGKPYIMAIEGCIHDGWLLIRNTKNKFDLKYLCHMLSTENMHRQYVAKAAGSTVNNLNKELVGSSNVPLTNYEEQKKIGLFLESLETFITLYQQKLEILQKIKKSLLQEMFV